MSSSKLAAMEPDERAAFCREVMDRLSDLVEDAAPEEFCARVAELMDDCQPFHAYLNTLRRTIEVAHELGREGSGAALLDEEVFQRCIERVRSRLPDGKATGA